MAISANTGAGASFTSKYYVRNFYVANRSAGTSASRSEMSQKELSLADSMALRRAIKQLGSFDYGEESNADNIRNSVKAYIQTHNNMLSSSSRTADPELLRDAKKLKSLSNEYADDLDKIGITVNTDGTLKTRDSLFDTANIKKFEKLFSKGSDYMQRSATYTRSMSNRSNTLFRSEQIASSAARQNNNIKNSTPNDASDKTAAAAIVAQTTDLDALLHTGIGSNINLFL